MRRAFFAIGLLGGLSFSAVGLAQDFKTECHKVGGMTNAKRFECFQGNDAYLKAQLEQINELTAKMEKLQADLQALTTEVGNKAAKADLDAKAAKADLDAKAAKADLDAVAAAAVKLDDTVRLKSGSTGECLDQRNSNQPSIIYNNQVMGTACTDENIQKWQITK
jgi:glutamate-1-semialdehyde aminotransferase